MELEYNPEVGRELGWDLARFGWNPREDAPEDVKEGYKAGAAHFVRAQRKPDRFERKWLQLRQNALRRGKVVQPEITPEYFKSIDHPVCPVTLVEMTHGLNADTDWSVDRVNNDGAYAEGNLVIMSTLANRAKAGKSFAEVYRIASETPDDETFEGMGTRQWRRLASIMVGACATSSDKIAKVFPLFTRIPAKSMATDFHLLQWLLYRTTHNAFIRSRFVNRLNKLQPDKSKAVMLEAAAERLPLLVKGATDRFDASLDSGYMALLAKWHLAIPDAKQDKYMQMLMRISNSETVDADMVDKWLLETKGYFLE
jgi:hypothetical protein